jgi:transposase
MSGTFEKHVLPVHCPKCGSKIEKTVAWLRDNHELRCPCGTTSYLEPADVLAAVAALEAALRRIVRPTPGAEKVPV